MFHMDEKSYTKRWSTGYESQVEARKLIDIERNIEIGPIRAIRDAGELWYYYDLNRKFEFEISDMDNPAGSIVMKKARRLEVNLTGVRNLLTNCLLKNELSLQEFQQMQNSIRDAINCYARHINVSDKTVAIHMAGIST